MINLITNKNSTFTISNNLANHIIKTLFQSTDANNAINLLLSYIGYNFNLDKIILLEPNYDCSLVNITYEWNKNLTDKTEITSYYLDKDFLLSNKEKIVICNDFKNFNSNYYLYPLIKQLSLTSFVCFSLYNIKFRGFLIFSLTSSSNKWSDNTINTFLLISKFIGTYILNEFKNSFTKKEKQLAETIAQNQSLYSYAIKDNSYELKYISNNLTKIFPTAKLGELCYRSLKHKNSPCENCPIMLNDSNSINTKTIEYFDSYLNIWISSTVSEISLYEDEIVRLICFSNISNFIEQINSKDSLTGLLSLSKFQNSATKILENNISDNFAIVFSDINKFKYINETMGYSIGNTLLKEIALLFSSYLYEDELVCRNGDDKFILLLKYNSISNLKKRIEFFNKKIVELQNNKFKSINIALISGISLASTNNKNIIQLIDRSNITRKTLKNSHKSTYSIYDDKLHLKITKEKSIEYKMKSALINKEFIVYLQPKINLSNMEISGAEALVRWLPPNENLIPPTDFIPLFEKNGFIIELDFYVYEEIFKVLRSWLDEKKIVVPISLNVSRIHLKDFKFVPRLKSLISKYDLPTNLIELEITESGFFEDTDKLLKIITDLKNFGLTFSIDDFGSGYSSLNILKDLPIDVLKLDKGFFPKDNITQKEKIIVSTIVDMAKKLEIKILSEGIETKEQCEFLANIGCDMVQGYVFAKPMSILNFEEMLCNKKRCF